MAGIGAGEQQVYNYIIKGHGALGTENFNIRADMATLAQHGTYAQLQIVTYTEEGGACANAVGREEWICRGGQGMVMAVDAQTQMLRKQGYSLGTPWMSAFNPHIYTDVMNNVKLRPTKDPAEGSGKKKSGVYYCNAHHPDTLSTLGELVYLGQLDGETNLRACASNIMKHWSGLGQVGNSVIKIHLLACLSSPHISTTPAEWQNEVQPQVDMLLKQKAMIGSPGGPGLLPRDNLLLKTEMVEKYLEPGEAQGFTFATDADKGARMIPTQMPYDGSPLPMQQHQQWEPAAAAFQQAHLLHQQQGRLPPPVPGWQQRNDAQDAAAAAAPESSSKKWTPVTFPGGGKNRKTKNRRKRKRKTKKGRK